MTAANAVEEAGKEGKSLDIPYRRKLKADDFLNEKYPGDKKRIRGYWRKKISGSLLGVKSTRLLVTKNT